MGVKSVLYGARCTQTSQICVNSDVFCVVVYVRMISTVFQKRRFFRNCQQVYGFQPFGWGV